MKELGGGSGFAALVSGLNKWLLEGQTIPVRLGDWYWTATRAIPDTINEFPFFTFLYGDLHAHLIAIPFTLVALGLAAHLVLSRIKLQWYDLALTALVLGALRAINTWDYPTYLGIAGATIILRLRAEQKEGSDAAPFAWQDWLQQWLRFILIVFFQVILLLIPMNVLGIRMTVEVAIYGVLLLAGIMINLNHAGRAWDPLHWVQRFGWRFLAIIVLSVFFFLPYILNYATGYVSAELWKGDKTTFNEYLTVHGIFLFITATFFIVVILKRVLERNPQRSLELEFTGWSIYLLPLLIILNIALIALKFPILALVLPFLGLGIWLLLHRKTTVEISWVTTLIIVSILLTLLVEYIVLKGDIGRANTVFKFYLQAWVMFGVAGATGLGFIIQDLVLSRRAPISAGGDPAESPFAKFPGLTFRNIRWAWWTAFTLLILAGLLYPITAARARMDDRFVQDAPPGINGMDYMTQGATYKENNQELQLRWDYDAIQWMRQNIKGSPVIMEGNTGLYHWGNRFSIYTGLPTVIGWDWHTKQQYSLIPGDRVDYRIGLVKEFYNTPDQARAMEIARRYDVSYVIVGGLEHAVYDANGLSKFDQASDVWSLVYQNKQVKIYQIH